MGRGDADIEKYACKRASLERESFEPGLNVLTELLEATVLDRETRIGAKPLACMRDRLGVLVQCKQPPLLTELRENPSAVSPSSVRAVDVAGVFSDRQARKRLAQEHRLMTRFFGHTLVRSDSQFRKIRIQRLVAGCPLSQAFAPPFFVPKLELLTVAYEHGLLVQAREFAQRT